MLLGSCQSITGSFKEKDVTTQLEALKAFSSERMCFIRMLRPIFDDNARISLECSEAQIQISIHFIMYVGAYYAFYFMH